MKSLLVISLNCEKLVSYFTKQLFVVLVISLNNRENLVGYFTKQP